MSGLRNHGHLVLTISGRTMAGKSTLADALAQALGWPLASFGRYVRAEARARGSTAKREDLQEIGAELINSFGWEKFCRRTLAHAGLDTRSVPCIIEGVRHVDALVTLGELFERVPIYLVYLDISDEHRNRRLLNSGVAVRQGAEWERHSTEQHVRGTLAGRADLIVPAAEQPATCVSTILDWLRE